MLDPELPVECDGWQESHALNNSTAVIQIGNRCVIKPKTNVSLGTCGNCAPKRVRGQVGRLTRKQTYRNSRKLVGG